MKRVLTHVAALVGAAVGFYAGLITMIAAGGLDSAGWAPLFMSAGAGLLAGTGVAVFASSAGARIAMIGLAGGALLGAALTAIDPDITVIAILLAVGSQCLAVLPRSGNVPWVRASHTDQIRSPTA